MAGAVLSAHEREEIRVGLEAAESFTDIARRLDRAPSTVSQEVGRNGGRLSYCAADASVRAAKNRCRPRLTKFQRNRPMTDHVEARLVALDSPTTIAIELARAGGIGGDTVSAETIYQGVYGHGTRGLATGLGAKLHRKRSRRKLRCRAGDAPAKAGPLKEFSLIGLRPTSVEDRTEPGHWEGDLIIGAKNASAVVTLVERTSRLNLLGDLPEGHDAESVLACLLELPERVPATTNWLERSTSASSLPSPTTLGSGGPTRTSTVWSAATSGRARTSPPTPSRISTGSVSASTPCPAGYMSGTVQRTATMPPSLR